MPRKKKQDEQPTGPIDQDTAEYLADRDDNKDIEILSPDEYRLARAQRIWSFDDTGHDLTVDQALFCRSYIIDRNPVAALRRLNYADHPEKLKRIAAKYLENTEVQGCIEVLAKQMMERLAITADNVNARLAAVAFFDPRSVLEFDHLGVKLKHSRFWTKDEALAIQSIKVGQHGVELKLHDGVRAAEMLGKQLGSIPDQDAETAARTSRAAAEAVVDTIVDIFRKTSPELTGKALPPPAEETKH